MIKKHANIIFGCILFLALLAACATADETSTKASPPAVQLEPTSTIGTALTTTNPPDTTAPTAQTIATDLIQETSPPVSFPLSELGPYFAGNRSYKIVDENRNGREINVTIHYPALKQTDANGHIIRHNAAADLSNAPYPLILTEIDTGSYLLQSHLATHGFVMAAIFRSPSAEHE